MEQYKESGVYLARDCACAKLLRDGKVQEAEKVFKETTKNFETQIPNKEDRNWLMAKSKGRI